MSKLGHVVRGGRANIPRFYAPSSFLNRPLGPTDTVATDQSPAQNIANQMHYGYSSWTPLGGGYTGIGYGNTQWPYSMGYNGPATYSHPLFCVRPSIAAQNITFQKVGGYFMSGGSPFQWSAGQYSNLQSHWNSVPIPDKTLCPFITGATNYTNIWAGGTDKSCCIWNLDTDEMWEFWELQDAASYPAASAVCGSSPWTAQYGAYIPSASTFNGVLPNNWGSRACSLGEVGGFITYQDMVNAWHGEPICHAICIGAPMNSGSFVAPATRGDGPGANGNNVPLIPVGFPGAGGANPAYHHDVTSEGQRFRFPVGTTATAVAGGLTHPTGIAACLAIETYGMYIVDTSGAVAIYIEDDRTFTSPYQQYGPNAVDPFTLNWSPWRDPRWDDRDPAGWNVFHHLPWTSLQALNTITS